jgi:DNA-binding SARP family transcriptional activator
MRQRVRQARDITSSHSSSTGGRVCCSPRPWAADVGPPARIGDPIAPPAGPRYTKRPALRGRDASVTLISHGPPERVAHVLIRLSMLGAVDLRGPDDGELRTVLAQPKRLALLAYLAVATPRAFHSRDTLLAHLWPGLDQEHARAALRQTLYGLRRALGDGVLVTCGDGVIGLDHRHIWCDVTAFDRALDAGNRAEALNVYGGELLAGFHVSGAPDFDRWLDGQRARLAARAAAAAWALAECEERRGNLSGALEWARRLLAINPGDERALRRVVALLDQLGDRVAALRVYREFAQRIAADYAMEPAAETEALIAAIRSRVRSSHPAELHGPESRS